MHEQIDPLINVIVIWVRTHQNSSKANFFIALVLEMRRANMTVLVQFFKTRRSACYHSKH